MPAHGTSGAPKPAAVPAVPAAPVTPGATAVPALPSMSELLAAGVAATAVSTPPDEKARNRRDAA